MPVNDVGNKQFRNDLVSLLKAAWGVLEGVHDHEQSGVAVVESWRMDELEEELGKWGAWFSPSRSRKSLSRETRRGEMSDITKERKGELKAKLQKIHAGSWRTYMLITDQNIKDLIALMEVLPDKRSQVEKPIMRNDETYGEGRGYRAGKGAVIISGHDVVIVGMNKLHAHCHAQWGKMKVQPRRPQPLPFKPIMGKIN